MVLLLMLLLLVLPRMVLLLEPVYVVGGASVVVCRCRVWVVVTNSKQHKRQDVCRCQLLRVNMLASCSARRKQAEQLPCSNFAGGWAGPTTPVARRKSTSSREGLEPLMQASQRLVR